MLVLLHGLGNLYGESFVIIIIQIYHLTILIIINLDLEKIDLVTYVHCDLRFAIAVFGSPELQERFAQVPPGMIGGLNSIGILATEIAWRDCDPWLDRLLPYLQGNRDYLVAEFARRCPAIRLQAPESTFLAWLDCRGVQLNRSPHEHFMTQAGVAYNNGEDFGPGGRGGDGFVRLNFGTSQSLLSNIIDKTIESLP